MTSRFPPLTDGEREAIEKLIKLAHKVDESAFMLAIDADNWREVLETIEWYRRTPRK